MLKLISIMPNALDNPLQIAYNDKRNQQIAKVNEMRPKGARVVVRGYSLKPEHVAAIHQFAKDEGLMSRSAALRRIIDDWLKIQAIKADLKILAEAEA